MRRLFWIALIFAGLISTEAGAGRKNTAGLVDLNSASAAELMALPGVTPVWAQRIVRYRPYRSKLELMNEGIVPQGLYERIEGLVVAHRRPKNG